MSVNYATVRQNVVALLMKVETTFGNDATPGPTTDGFLLNFSSAAPAELITEAFTYDGSIGENSLGLQQLRHSSPTGRSAALAATMYPRGYGGAYSATHLPPNGFDVGMQVCGFGKTVVTTPGSESVTYAPLGDATIPPSATVYAYAGQLLGGNVQILKAVGMLGNFKLSTTDQKPPMATFDLKGIYSGDMTEGSYTAPTIVDTPAVPNSAGMTFTAGGTALNLYAATLDCAREITSARVPNTAAGAHLGFVAGPWKPTLTVTVEQEAQSTYNPWSLRAAASTAALVCGWNQTTQYNRHKVTAAQAQLTGIKQSAKGRIKCWDLTYTLLPSSPTGVDALAVVFD